MTAVLPKSNGIPQSTVAELNARRIDLGVQIKDLCHTASVGAQTYWRMVRGLVEPQRRTLVKLSRALDRLSGTAPAPEPAPKVVAAFYRAAALFLAHELGADPGLVLGDEGQSCPQDPAWLRASRARQAAFYLAHVELGVTHSALAAAVGTTKQRVHKAVNRIEDLRDDEGLDALLERASAFFSGRRPPAETAGTVGKGIVP